MAQGATRPWSTYLFSAEKMPESHIPSKSIISIHTPIRGWVGSVGVPRAFEPLDCFNTSGRGPKLPIGSPPRPPVWGASPDSTCSDRSLFADHVGR